VSVMKFRLVISTEIEIPFDPERYPAGSEPAEALAFEVQEAFLSASENSGGLTEVVGRVILDQSEVAPQVDRIVRRGGARVWPKPEAASPTRRRASSPA
jgi:hypothetical protein